MPLQIQELDFKKNQQEAGLKPERYFFSTDLLCRTPCPRKGLMEFRREPLREHRSLFTISVQISLCLCWGLLPARWCWTRALIYLHT